MSDTIERPTFRLDQPTQLIACNDGTLLVDAQGDVHYRERGQWYVHRQNGSTFSSDIVLPATVLDRHASLLDARHEATRRDRSAYARD